MSKKVFTHRPVLLALAVGAVLGLAAVAAGCGGDDDSGTSAGAGNTATAGGGEGSSPGGADSGQGQGQGDGGGQAGDGDGSREDGGGEGGQGSGADGGGQGDGGGQAGGAGSQSGGGGESQSGDSAGDSGKAEFVKAASAMCTQVRAKTGKTLEGILKNNGGLGALSNPVVMKRLVAEAMVPGLEEKIRRLESLDRPASADGAAEAVIGAAEKTLDEARSDPGEFNPEGKAVAQSTKVAKANGIPACGGL